MRVNALESKIDAYDLAFRDDPRPEERAALTLASCYAQERDPNYAAVSWAEQQRAVAFYNAHGLYETLSEILRIDPTALDSGVP